MMGLTILGWEASRMKMLLKHLELNSSYITAGMSLITSLKTHPSPFSISGQKIGRKLKALQAIILSSI